MHMRARRVSTQPLTRPFTPRPDSDCWHRTSHDSEQIGHPLCLAFTDLIFLLPRRSHVPLTDSNMTLPTATDSTVAYLRSLGAVRARSKQVYDLIVAGKADHWDWDESKLQTVIDFCAGLIQVSCR